MFYTTGDLPFTDDVRDYLFNDWVKKKGHGFIGAHSAADTYHNYEPYWEMLGGTFNGHPWGLERESDGYGSRQESPGEQALGRRVRNHRRDLPFKHWQPEKVHVLMSLNMAKTRLKKPYHVPIAWVKNYGDGKVLHMSLGHREDVWTNPEVHGIAAGRHQMDAGHGARRRHAQPRSVQRPGSEGQVRHAGRGSEVDTAHLPRAGVPHSRS